VTTTLDPLLRIEGVSRAFDGVPAVDKVTLEVAAGEYFTLLGASGSGKTTLLRIVAGLERADSGRVVIGGDDMTSVAPYARPVNMMFQSYALFPHMTVFDNVAFGLRQEGLPRAEIARRVGEMLGLVEMAALVRRKPHQLSGGQAQRVALARSLVKHPRLLLLDEPLAALDAKLRARTRLELKRIQKRVGIAFVMVTHDQEEAMIVSDRLAVMDAGRILQVGTPHQVYETPASRFVARFVGAANLFEGHVVGRDGGNLAVDCGAVGVIAVRGDDIAAGGSAVAVAVRPEKMALGPPSPTPAPGGGINRLPVKVLGVVYQGGVSTYDVEAAGGLRLSVEIANRARHGPPPFAAGDAAVASWPADAGVVLVE
jgi:putrescine transport system ATP-binding protein